MRLLLGLGAALLALGVAGAQDVRAGCNPSLAPRDGFPRWSPDSRQIAFVRARIGCSASSAVYIVGRDGGVRHLANGGSLDPPSPPAWSPDGKLIALSSGGRLVVINGRASTTSRLVASRRRGRRTGGASPSAAAPSSGASTSTARTSA
jgi:Tol biopolymer transport system component